MKKRSIFITLLLTGILASNTQAQEHGPNLCRTLEHAHLNPTTFHEIVKQHWSVFTPEMKQYIQNRTQLLLQRADEHDQSCDQFPPFSQPYHNCKANNLPRQYAIYLGSLWIFLNGGIAWTETEYGRIAIDGLKSCQLFGNCAQMRAIALQAIKSQCPYYLE